MSRLRRTGRSNAVLPAAIALLLAIPSPSAGSQLASASCRDAVLLVDRSGSMAEHDPGGALRRGVVDAFDRSRRGRRAQLAVFDEQPGPLLPAAGPASLEPLLRGELAIGDAGGTDAERAVARIREQQPHATVIVILDAEGATLGAGTVARAAGRLVVVGIGDELDGPAARRVQRAGGLVVAAATLEEAGRAGERAARAGCGAPASTSAPAPAPGEPAVTRSGGRRIVLIAGLATSTEEVRGASRPADCRPAGALRPWCRALSSRGWRVWIPAMRPGGGHGAIDSTGSLLAGSRRLARWLRTGPGRDVVLVGHSMGGLLATAAVNRRGAGARGLVTVGTPHAGSFGADAYAAAAAVGAACRRSCRALGTPLAAAARRLRRRFGAALVDLTWERRMATDRLGAPKVPLAVYGAPVHRLGPGIDTAGRRPGYAFPNDGIVGIGSASGELAGASPVLTMLGGTARHSSSVPPLFRTTQLDSTKVSGFVADAADAFWRGGPSRPVTSPVRITAPPPLRTWTSVRRLGGGGAAALRARVQPSSDGAEGSGVPGIVVASRPQRILCDGREIPLAPVLGGELWALDPDQLRCAGLDADAGGSAALVVGAPGTGAAAGSP